MGLTAGLECSRRAQPDDTVVGGHKRMRGAGLVRGNRLMFNRAA